MLTELRNRGAVTVADNGNVILTDSVDADEKLSDGELYNTALASIAEVAPTDVPAAVKHLDDHLGKKLRAELTASGELREEHHKTLGLIDHTRWIPADPAVHQSLVARVGAAAINPPSEQTSAASDGERTLVALLAAAGALSTLMGTEAASAMDEAALADADPITATVRRMVRARRFAAAAEASAGGTTGGISSWPSDRRRDWCRSYSCCAATGPVSAAGGRMLVSSTLCDVESRTAVGQLPSDADSLARVSRWNRTPAHGATSRDDDEDRQPSCCGIWRVALSRRKAASRKGIRNTRSNAIYRAAQRRILST